MFHLIINNQTGLAYGHQNPLAKDCEGNPPAETECVELEASVEINMAVQNRCMEEGVIFEIAVGQVKNSPIYGIIHKVRVDGRTFQMSKVWWLRGSENPYLNISYNRIPPTET